MTPQPAPSRNGGTHRRASAAAALALCAILSACGDAAPPDDARVDALSQAERVALCDELRDDIAAEDEPIRCSDGSSIHWEVPSNQLCRELDLSMCDAGSVGELRAFHRSMQGDPCAALAEPSLDNQATDFACSARLAPLPRAEPAPCPTASLIDLAKYDGVYQIYPWDRAGGAEFSGVCDEAAPPLFSGDAPYFVLVATDQAGRPSVALQSCRDLSDCQGVAAQIRVTGGSALSAGAATVQRWFGACAPIISGTAPALDSFAPPGSEGCATQHERVEVTLLDGQFGVYLQATSVESSGSDLAGSCNIVVSRSENEPVCNRTQLYGGQPVVP